LYSRHNPRASRWRRNTVRRLTVAVSATRYPWRPEAAERGPMENAMDVNQDRGAHLLQDDELNAVSGGGNVGANETITVSGGRTEGPEEVYHTVKLMDYGR
jgi:hypothetical protein